MNREYLSCLGGQSFSDGGGRGGLRGSFGALRLALVTNGITSVQRSRLAASPSGGFFAEDVYISQEMGVAKPKRKYFDLVLARMGVSDRNGFLWWATAWRRTSPAARPPALDTCWFNPGGKPRSPAAVPTHEIRSLKELKDLVIS
jgi:2-haloacid dehalogenase